MKRSLAAMLLAVTTLTACSQDNGRESPGKAQLEARESEWNQAYARHDAAALAQMYADDAAIANPGSPLVSGKDAIAKETAGFASDPNLKVEFAADRVHVAKSGDLAYTRGHYTLTTTDPASGKPIDSTGNYLTVWKKQDDGKWRAVEDFITPGPQPTQSPD